MTKKEFTDYLFKIMYESGYRKAEVAKGGVFFLQVRHAYDCMDAESADRMHMFR